ncbi:hypothetical protein NL676_000372 [Syzygium grande]|nr:hypothetical protein NL676_000372 [Syzygium grande]
MLMDSSIRGSPFAFAGDRARSNFPPAKAWFLLAQLRDRGRGIAGEQEEEMSRAGGALRSFYCELPTGISRC